MAAWRVTEVRTVSRTFANHHGLPAPEVGHELEIGAEFGGGTFGTIHPVERLDGAVPRNPLAAKMFIPDALEGKDGMNAAARRIEEFLGAAEATGGAGWVELLLAVPYWVGWVERAGDTMLIGLMMDLRSRGYEKAPFSDPGDQFDYRRKRRIDRLELAASFADKASLLERIGFIHADINPENLLFDYTNRDVQVIDFDGGCLSNSGEVPFAEGKRDDCLPPELKPGRGGIPLKDRFEISSERWSVGIVIGYLVMGVSPTYFLRQITAETVGQYAKAFRWPDIDLGSPLFNSEPAGREAYRKMVGQGEFRAYPDAVTETMADMFSAGNEGDLRPTASRWLAVLVGNQTPPSITEFEVSEEFVLPGDEVTLVWNTEGAEIVEITGLERVSGSGRVSVRIWTPQSFSIRAINHFGETIASTVTVIPVELPVVPRVAFPATPDFELPPMPFSARAFHARPNAPEPVPDQSERKS